MARLSYIGLALTAGPNRTATAATLAIGVVVLALGRIPLAPGSELDLSSHQQIDGWTQASLFGFGPATERGRSIDAAPARIVWNRPLPRRFSLALDVTADTARARMAVSLGNQRELITVSQGPSHLVLDNPLGLRELGLASVPPGARLHLRRAAVR